MRRYKWYTILFLLLLVILQPYLMDWLSVKGISISFVLFFTMMTAIRIKTPDVLLVPVVIGFIYDMMYSPWLGRMAMVLLLGALAVLAVSRFVYRDNMPVLTVFFFVSTYLLENIRTVIETGPVVYHNNFMLIQGTILGISVYAAVLAAVFGTIYYIASFVKDKKLGARKNGTL